MPTNEYLPFAVGSSPNVMAQSDYAALPALQTGFLSGYATSSQVNKVLRQASVIASTLASYVVARTGGDVLDNGDVVGLENSLTAAIAAHIIAYLQTALGTGGTVYNPNFNSLTLSGLDTTGSGQLRLTYGNYGAIFRNDGSTLYILVTNNGTPTGQFNSIRPFMVDLATGNCSFGTVPTAPNAPTADSSNKLVTSNWIRLQGFATSTNAVFNGSFQVNGIANLVGSAITINPAALDNSQTVPTTNWVRGLFTQLFPASLNTNGYQKFSSNLIIQWGQINSFSGVGTNYNFPMNFPNSCFMMVSQDGGAPGSGTSNVHITSCVVLNVAAFQAHATDHNGTNAVTTVQWIAIGS